jgi:hypothetical protein
MTVHTLFNLSCDACGTMLPGIRNTNWNKMMEQAKVEGWEIGPKAVSIGIDAPDYCPSCSLKNKLKSNK